MGRRPCCVEEGLNRGSWSAIEDMILTSYINLHGEGKWRELPKRAGLKRCGKSCRLRWLNYLRPDIKRGNISKDEEDLIIKLQRLLGNRWSLIAGRLPGRTDNEIKNYWNTKLSKKIQGQTPKIRINGSVEKKAASESFVSSETPPVIRTKASRCTRVFLPRQEGNEITKKNGESSRDCSRPFSSFQQVGDDSLDMLAGFDMNELLFMSDDLNSNCLQICSDGIRGSSNLVIGEDGWNISSWCLDDPFSTGTDVMLQGGSGNEAIHENCSIDTLQPDEAFELKMLASFLS